MWKESKLHPAFTGQNYGLHVNTIEETNQALVEAESQLSGREQHVLVLASK